MKSPLLFWCKVSFFNLMIVALIGGILRYKIVFSLPFIDQKHLLHGHSHFAFAGWVSMILMAFLIAFASEKKGNDLFPKYKWYLWGNLITAYGMLLSFPFQGYGGISIFFSTLSIFNSWAFSYIYWKELKAIRVQNISIFWLKAALFFNCISALGAFGLAFMMANKIIHQNWYLLAIYFYLHFQYNGWFFFACMGLFIEKLLKVIPNMKSQNQIFWLFAITCFPAYFLSALWIPMPTWTYCIIVLAACLQLYAWIKLILAMNPAFIILWNSYKNLANNLMLISGFAVSLKLILQLLSTLPAISKLAFGFRPIVIAYLHLILLGMISLFLLANFIDNNFRAIKKIGRIGIIVFVLGIIFNECLLTAQGISAIFEQAIPTINEWLFVAAILLISGTILLNLGINKRT